MRVWSLRCRVEGREDGRSGSGVGVVGWAGGMGPHKVLHIIYNQLTHLGSHRESTAPPTYLAVLAT